MPTNLGIRLDLHLIVYIKSRRIQDNPKHWIQFSNGYVQRVQTFSDEWMEKEIYVLGKTPRYIYLYNEVGT